MATAPQDNLVGRIFSDRYRLTRKVGEGAMGQVYLARHTFMDKNVAVKVLHPALLGHDEVVERFQREAKAAAHIEHPNVCAATDFGRYDDTGLFLVMEWLDGLSVEQVIERDGPLDAARVVHIGIQVAEALQRAHELKIVHRDLKPANIMLVARDGDPDFVKVTDFGVARVPIGNNAKLTQAGTTYGTPSYMSPEQATGDEIDHRTDVYALGVTLFEMLTARVPFEGATIAHILSMHVTEPPPRPSSLVPDANIPAALEAIVLRCLEKSPDARFSTAADVSDALRAYRDAAPNQSAFLTDRIPEAASELTARSTAWATNVATELITDVKKRPPKVVAGVLGVVFLMIAGAVVVGLQAGSAVGEKVEEVKRATLAEERSEFARQPEITQALELQAQGKLGDAIAALKSAELNYQSNPHFHFLLGSAFHQKGEVVKAFGAFQKAVELRDDYRTDEGLRKAVLDAARVTDATQGVSDFVKRFADKALKDEIFQAAIASDEKKERAALQKVIRDSGMFESLGRGDQLALEVRDARGCKEIKPFADEAIQRRDTDEVIKYLDDLPSRGCGFLNRSDCYSCIRKDVEAEAVERGLRSEPKK